MRFLEKLAGSFFRNRGCEWTKRFAVLDAPVQDVFHFGAARVGQDAAIAQRARSPFRRALEPADNFSVGNMPRGRTHEFGFVELRNLHFVRRAHAIDHGANLGGRKLRPPVRVLHHEFARPPEDLVVHGEGRADRQARIARRRLNAHLLEGRRVENLAVGHAIESHAARQAQRLLTALLGEAVPVSNKDFLESRLHAGGEIVVALRERLAWFARRPEALLEVWREESAEHRRARRIAPGHVRALALVREIFEPEAERKRPVRPHDAPKLLEKFRLAVSCQAHHFVFVAEFPEAEYCVSAV